MSAKSMSAEDALAELQQLQSEGVILFENVPTADNVWLEGWSPELGQKQTGCVAGVTVSYLASGTLAVPVPPKIAAAPDALDARNALALAKFCIWLKETYGVHTLYHAGISGGGTNKDGSPRTDCHGRGRAVDFVGVAGTFVVADTGEQIEYGLTVLDNWGSADTPATPGGLWPDGTGSAVHYRLDEPGQDPFHAEFFRAVYGYVTGEWQDQTSGPDDPGGSSIGSSSFVMHPDHPATAPGTPHGREAHQNHMHWQIGVT